MTATDLTDRLQKISIFSALDEAGLAEVAALVVPFSTEAGHILVQPGMVGQGMFLIEEGTVRLEVHDHNVELGPGDFVGELAILDDRAVRTTRVKTTSPVTGYCITRDAFAELLVDQPQVAVPMLRALAHRLVDTVMYH